jgi:hypothetical protein
VRLLGALLAVGYWAAIARLERVRARAADWWDGTDAEREQLRAENMRLRQDLASARTIDGARRRDNDELQRQLTTERARRLLS